MRHRTKRWLGMTWLGDLLRRARRAKLRTRVLTGVLLVTLLALAGFDIAAVSLLRGYLMGQTDSQLAQVLGQYRVMDIPVPQVLRQAAGATPKQVPIAPAWVNGGNATPVSQRVISGPIATLPGALGRYYVATVANRKPAVMIGGNPGLIPRLPSGLATLARSHQAMTVTSRDGHDQLRLMAASYPKTGVAYATTSLDTVNKTVRQLELILIVGSAAAGLLAAVGTAWVMRRGLRPVETMAGQAAAITAGDLTSRVSPHDPSTEIGRLGAALNGMLTRIGDFVTEREASQEATRRFFADASHELRTPLASLRANAELYQQGALTERSAVDEAMRRITLEAKRMGSLVDDMLRLARLEQHHGLPTVPDRDPVDLTAVINGCAERARAADPLRTWRASIAPGLVVSGDEELLRRAVDNLLTNVSAHTPAGTTATITAAAGDGGVVVDVSDDGPGVPHDQLPRIFDRFYRVPGSARQPGSGLGLAIVAAVADSHDGAVTAQPADSCGLRVTLTLATADSAAALSATALTAARPGAACPTAYPAAISAIQPAALSVARPA